MKKILSIILVVVMVLGSMSFVMADDGIKITIDGEAKTFDVMPQIIDGRTLVPMRAIFEALGAEVGWDDATKTATGKTATTTVTLTIDKKAAKVNNKVIALDVAAQIIESRTMVPARFVAESLGCKVDWDGNTKTVIISKDAGGNEEPAKTEKPAAIAGSKLVVVSFEGNSAAPSSGLNFWGKKADGKNTSGLYSYVNWSDVPTIGKPDSDDDFGATLLKLDTANLKEPPVNGIHDGRINDIPKEMVNFKAGRKYTMYVWVYLAETTNGGDSAKMSMSAYANDKANGFKTNKSVTVKKGEWTRIELPFEVKSEQEGASTGARFGFAGIAEGDSIKAVYMDNLTIVGDAEGTSAPVVTEKKEEAAPVVAPSTDNAQPTKGTSLVKIGFEENNAAPSTGINFWGKDETGKNTDGSFKYVTYTEAGISKPNTTDDFGSIVLKLDSSLGKKPAVSGIVDGRINDIPADLVSYVKGGKYKATFWVCVAETTTGGNSVKLSMNVYANKTASGFKSSAKTFTLEKGKWTKIELDITVGDDHVSATTGLRFNFADVDGTNPSVIYIDNVEFLKAE